MNVQQHKWNGRIEAKRNSIAVHTVTHYTHATQTYSIKKSAFGYERTKIKLSRN